MSRIKKAQVSTFATLHVIFTFRKIYAKAANQIVLCKREQTTCGLCTLMCGSSGCRIFPKVWYRTPGLVVSFLEDTGKNKNKQEKK